MAQLKFEKVFYCNGENTILNDISFEVESGDYISIMGPSGSGKSTLLKLCCHLISPSSGTILFNENDIMQLDPLKVRKKICYCFQTPVLFGETVEDNLAYPYSIRKKSIDHDRIKSLFTQFNMEYDYMKHDIKNLSGGEKQRIALIRTLLFKPDILLLDEVTSALDVDNTLMVETAIKAMNHEGVTIMWVTHNPEQGKRNADKMLTIDNGKMTALEVLK